MPTWALRRRIWLMALSVALAFGGPPFCPGQDFGDAILLDVPPETASAAQTMGPGATVVVLSKTPLKDSGRVVGHASPGTLYRIKRLRGRWVELAIDRGAGLGWIRLDQLAAREEAIDEIERRLRANPSDSEARVARGRMRMEEGDLAEAKNDLEQARRADPLSVEPLYWLARMTIEGSPEEAEAYLTEAIGLDANDARLYSWRAWLRGLQGNYAGRRFDLEAKAKLGKATVAELRSLAWEFATHSDATVRDGKKAVDYAQKADVLEEGESDEGLEVLAAAFAEDGKFVDAVETQRRLTYKNRKGDDGFLDSRRLKDYEANTAVRQTQDEIWRRWKRPPTD